MKLILPRKGYRRSTAAHNKAPLLSIVDRKDCLSYEKSDDDEDVTPSSSEEDGLLHKKEHINILETLSASTSTKMIGADKSKEEAKPDTTVAIGWKTSIIIESNQESKSSPSPSPSPSSPPTHERNGSHGTTSTATTKVAAHTTTSIAEIKTSPGASTSSSASATDTKSPNLQVNPKEERRLDQLVQFIDTIMTGTLVETTQEQPEEVEPAHADSPPVITSDDLPEGQHERECLNNEDHYNVAGDDLTPTEEKDVDYNFYINENLDDVVVSMMDDVSVSISVALSGILSSNADHDNERIRENGPAAKVLDKKERGKSKVVDEDEDVWLTTEIEGSRGIHHDAFGNTEIFHLEPSMVPFQLSYVSGNTELILIRQKNESNFFCFPISKGIGSVKMIGERLARSAKSSKKDGLSSTSLPPTQASSDGQTCPPPLDDISSTGSETSDDESTTSETSQLDGEDFQEDVQILLKSLRSDISAMTSEIIFPSTKDGNEGGGPMGKDEPSVSRAFADIVMQVNRDAYDGLITLCVDAMKPQGTGGAVPSAPLSLPATVDARKKKEMPPKLQSTIQLVASDLTDASAYSADSRD